MSTPVSVIVTYASTGSGHRLAAEAIARELAEAPDDAVAVQVIDALDGSPAWPARLADGTLTSSPLGRSTLALLSPLLSAVARDFAARLVALQPAAIVSSHPLTTIIAADLVARGRIRARVIVAPTDFDLAGATLRRGVALHCVADDACAETLANRGAGDIAVTGIPVRTQFTVEYDTAAARAHFDLPGDRRVILAIAGSATPEPYARLKEALAVSLPALASLPDTSVAVVAGHDSAFSAEITSRSKGFGTTNVRVFDYVEHMAPLIACADLVIAKPTGLVCAECVDSGVPLVLVDPSDAHEHANAHTLATAGVAVVAEDPSTLSDRARKVLSSPKKLDHMREATAVLSRPFAAADIARRTLELAGVTSPDEPGFAS